MTEISTTPVPADDSAEDAAFETMCADAVLMGRAVSSGQFLAGLLAAAELETASRPDKLPMDLFSNEDPAVVQAVWDRALAVGFQAGRVSAAPRLFRDQLDRLAGEFEAAGFEAMAGSVRRSRNLVAPVREGLPGDSGTGREH